MNITHMSHEYMYNYTDGSATNVVQDGGSSYKGAKQLCTLRQLGSIAPTILQKLNALEQGSKAVDDLTDQTNDVVFCN